MPVWFYFAIFASVVLFVLTIPDIFPQCSCCRKKKFRAFFRIHRAVSVSPGYDGNRSVCRKCCKKYGIETLKDLERIIAIQKKIKLESIAKSL